VHMMLNRARIGVVGAGWWSTYTHIPGLLENRNAELVAVCDTNEAVRTRVLEAFAGLKMYEDLSAMLSDESLDGVVIAVPHKAHHAVAAQCLDRGLHVMLEKPMTLTARDAEDLLARASEQGVEVIVGYPWNFTRTAIRARNVLSSAQLGGIQHVQCMHSSMVIEFYRGNESAYQPVFGWTVSGPGDVYARPELSGGGQGHLQVTHSSGLMFFVTGLRAARVSMLMNTFGLPVDLVNAMTVEFEGGSLGSVASTGNVPVGDPGRLDLHVYCEDGYLLLDAIRGVLVIHSNDGQVVEDRLDPEDTYPRFDTAANLVDVCLGTAKNGSSGEVGLRSVEMLDAAYRSADRGGAMVAVGDLYD